MWNKFLDQLTKTLKETGIAGGLTYIAGVISFGALFFNADFDKQILFGTISLILFLLASILTYFRIKMQNDRDKCLIDMVKNSSKELSCKVGSNCSNEQVVSITQSIAQTQKDLIEKMSNY